MIRSVVWVCGSVVWVWVGGDQGEVVAGSGGRAGVA